MQLVSGFTDGLQRLADAMTGPTFSSFLTIITGWVFAGRRTITRIILCVGDSATKHFSSYHRVFSFAKWSLDELGLALFGLIEPFQAETILLALDDTLARKRGLTMFGTGMHHDPILSSRGKAVMNWGHSWVVLGVLIEFPFRKGHVYCLPILFRLYLNRKSAAKHRRTYRTRPELGLQLITLLCSKRQNRRFHVIADSAYGGQSVLRNLPENCDLTSRMLLNARLYDAPPVRKPGTNGRPRIRGKQLPTPQQMLQGRCRRITLSIYGRREQARVADLVGHPYKVPDRSLRVVASEAIRGGRGKQVFYSTCVDATAEQVIGWYAMRWSVEVMNHDSKQHLGFEEPQGWSRRAVERTAPVAMLLYSLIVMWFAREGHQRWQPITGAWYRSKASPSFADMLITLRRLSIRQQVSKMATQKEGFQKLQRLLENTVSMTT